LLWLKYHRSQIGKYRESLSIPLEQFHPVNLDTFVTFELVQRIFGLKMENIGISLLEESEDDYEAIPNSSMAVNMMAGSLAGITEHVVMYPFDAIKVCSLNCGTKLYST
jgi:hypothetical protein